MGKAIRFVAWVGACALTSPLVAQTTASAEDRLIFQATGQKSSNCAANGGALVHGCILPLSRAEYRAVTLSATASGMSGLQAKLLQPCMRVARVTLGDIAPDATNEAAIAAATPLLSAYRDLLSRCVTLQGGAAPALNIEIKTSTMWVP